MVTGLSCTERMGPRLEINQWLIIILWAAITISMKIILECFVSFWMFGGRDSCRHRGWECVCIGFTVTANWITTPTPHAVHGIILYVSPSISGRGIPAWLNKKTHNYMWDHHDQHSSLIWKLLLFARAMKTKIIRDLSHKNLNTCIHSTLAKWSILMSFCGTNTLIDFLSEWEGILNL